MKLELYNLGPISESTKQVLAETHYWRPCNRGLGGQLATRRYSVLSLVHDSASVRRGNANIYDDNYFRAIHPDLPRLLYYLTQEIHGKSIVCPGMIVLSTLVLWNNPSLALRPEDQTMPSSQVYTVLSIDGVNVRDDHPDAVDIEFQHLQTTTSNENIQGRCLYYALSEHTARTLVRRSWLDRHFPQWQQRYLQATALDLEQGDLVSYVLPMSKSTPVASETPPLQGL